jgi:hypothetical protein
MDRRELEVAATRACVALVGVLRASGASAARCVAVLEQRCALWQRAAACQDVRVETAQQLARLHLSLGNRTAAVRALQAFLPFAPASLPIELLAEFKLADGAEAGVGGGVARAEKVDRAARDDGSDATSPPVNATPPSLLLDAALLALARRCPEAACDAARECLRRAGRDAPESSAAVAVLVEGLLRCGAAVSARDTLARFVFADPAARLRPQAVASLSTLAELTLAPARVRDWRDAIRIIARDAAVDLPPLP